MKKTPLMRWLNCRDSKLPKQKGLSSLTRIPLRRCKYTLYFGIKAIRRIFSTQKLAVQPNPIEREQKCFRFLFVKAVHTQPPDWLRHFFGLGISDLLSLRWEQLLNEDDKFAIYEKKTNKRRIIKINVLPFHFSTHSLRKTFGRKIFELASSQGQGELALIKLSELFNHSNASITRIYLGIKEEEMLSTYDMLEF